MQDPSPWNSQQRRKWAIPAGVLLLLVFTLASWNSGVASSSYGSSTSLSAQDTAALTNATRDACAKVMNKQKTLLFDTFSEVFDGVRNIALISVPDHENKGDSAIMTAEMMLLSTLGINVVYSCGVKDYDLEALTAAVDEYGSDHFAIVFHGGGNFGDLYTREHGLKLDVMSTFPDIRMHVFPQSLKFRSDATMQATKDVLSKLKHASIAVRDHQSYDFAMKHFAHSGLRVDLTPDIVFFMGFRPELREHFGKPAHDLLLFRRADGERTDWTWAGGASSPDFPKPFVQSLEAGGKELTYKAGDWSGDFDITAAEKGDGEQSHIEFRSWKRFMMGAEWLSSGEFVILDRLHGHIFSLVLGIPHVLIDNKIGKLSDYYSTWTSECPLGTLVAPEPTESAVRAAYRNWVERGQINGRMFV